MFITDVNIEIDWRNRPVDIADQIVDAISAASIKDQTKPRYAEMCDILSDRFTTEAEAARL